MKSILKRTAVILCGGKGSRLGLIGKKIPKCLVLIHNKPIIWYILKVLIKNNFNHFIIPTGYRSSMIKKYLSNNKDFKNLHIEIIETGLNTTIAKRIFLIKKKIISKNFLLLNGDAIFDLNVNKIFKKHVKNKVNMTLIGCEAQLAFGTVGIEKGKIVSFDREITYNAVKVSNKKAFTGYVYSGMNMMSLDILKVDFKNYINFEKELYPKIIKKYKCKFVNPKGFWHSIDNIKDIDILNKKNSLKKYKSSQKLLINFNKI